MASGKITRRLINACQLDLRQHEPGILITVIVPSRLFGATAQGFT